MLSHAVYNGPENVGINALPEELLDHIVSCLAPENPKTFSSTATLKSLVAISLVSQRLHRIAEPHLYCAVPITLNKSLLEAHVFYPPTRPLRLTGQYTFQVPSKLNSNALAFVGTIASRPRLATYVRYLSLVRNDVGFFQRFSLGMCGRTPDAPPAYTVAELEVASCPERAIDMASERVASIIPNLASVRVSDAHDTDTLIAQRILRMLPQVVHLNRSEYFTDTPLEVLDADLILANYLDHPKEIFAPHLRELTMACVQSKLLNYYHVLALPTLESLGLHRAPYNRPDGDYRKTGDCLSALLAKCNAMPKSRLRNVSLVGFSAKYWVGSVALSALSDHTALHTLEIHEIQTDASATHICLAAFRSSFSTLKTLVVAAKDPCESGGRYDARMHRSSLVRANTILENLIIYLGDLIKMDEHDTGMDEQKEIITCKLFNVNGDCRWYSVDLHLPRSLVTLELRIGKDRLSQIMTLQEAVLNILGRLAGDVRAWFPVLEKLILRWGPGQAHSYDPREHDITMRMEQQGVEVVFVYVSPGEPGIDLDAEV